MHVRGLEKRVLELEVIMFGGEEEEASEQERKCRRESMSMSQVFVLLEDVEPRMVVKWKRLKSQMQVLRERRTSAKDKENADNGSRRRKQRVRLCR